MADARSKHGKVRHFSRLGIYMFDLIFKIVFWLWKLWDHLPSKVKQQIIEAIVESYEDIFRTIYRRFYGGEK